MWIYFIILTIPTFLILNWVLKKYIKNQKNRKISTIIGTIILTPILFYGIIYLFLSFIFYEPQYKFDKEKWFNEKHQRFEMRDDIVKREIFLNKSKKGVLNFIGEPTLGDTTDIWIYELGMGGGGVVFQFNQLIVTFKNDTVRKVEKLEVID